MQEASQRNRLRVTPPPSLPRATGGVPRGCEPGAPGAVRDLVQAPSPSSEMRLSSLESSPLFQKKIFLLTRFLFFFFSMYFVHVKIWKDPQEFWRSV